METDIALPDQTATYDGFESEGEFQEPPSSPVETQDAFNSPSQFDAALFYNLQPLRKHLIRLNILCGILLGAHQTISHREARITTELDELWSDNAALRRRGLRGGTARTQRKQKGNYVKFKDHAAHGKQFLKHRMEVEQMDYLGRNRQAGLRALKELFDGAFTYVHNQQRKCQDILACTAMWGDTATELDVYIEFAPMIEKLLSIEIVDKIEDIEKMVETFNEEYDTSL